ncbi:MAG: hypothetical protein LC754_14370 [Acidobacteria bacterium]|nr:hypothetical protein [Acidobacteriota bacterium]
MRKIIACWLLALVCGLSPLAGCGGSAANNSNAPVEASAEQTLSELDSLTAELLKKVESARDPVSGLADAQTLLDARRAALASKIAAVKKSERFQQDNELRRHALESEIDNVMRVQGLRTRYLNEAGNAEFRERLDRLINDYQELFRG